MVHVNLSWKALVYKPGCSRPQTITELENVPIVDHRRVKQGCTWASMLVQVIYGIVSRSII